MTPMPMFPLGTVLFPHLYLPLNVFEPRYRALTNDCLAGDRRFGVVLIERGHEVGGGDDRFSMGTMATIKRAEVRDDGGFDLATIGGARIRVAGWLPDDPYPRADVEVIPDPEMTAPAIALLPDATRLVRRCFALKNELGDPAPPVHIPLADEPAVAVWQLAHLAPAGPLDKQRLLETEEHVDRLELICEVATNALDWLAHRLTDG